MAENEEITEPTYHDADQNKPAAIAGESGSNNTWLSASKVTHPCAHMSPV